MKIWLITLTYAILLCACNEQASEKEQVRQPERAVSSEETVQQLIADGLLTLEIHYEAFTCFQGTLFEDGSVTYYPNGTFIMFHREFPNCRLRFEFSDQGVIKPILDMKEQDAP